jgi:hypothetical protein
MEFKNENLIITNVIAEEKLKINGCVNVIVAMFL